MNSALATTQWQTFTERYWNVKRLALEYAPKGHAGPVIRALLYADGRGRLVLPACQPHLPLEFVPSATAAGYRVERQWMETARLLVEEMLARGTRGELTFPPTITDPRPFAWGRFRVTPHFTNLVDLPFSLAHADPAVRKQVAKAQRAGCRCERDAPLEHVLACLCGSEERRGFAYGMTLGGLGLARELLGPDAFRAYVCYAPGGEPATARVVLHRRTGPALDWMAGTRTHHLRSGATQLLIAHVLDDVARAGASLFNSCGADLEAVAPAKAMWGGRVVPQYCVQGYDLRSMERLLAGFVRHLQRRLAVRRSRSSGRDGAVPDGPGDARGAATLDPSGGLGEAP